MLIKILIHFLKHILSTTGSNALSCNASNHTYIGCFSDDRNRDLSEGPKSFGYVQSTCYEACKDYKYFALQANGWCVCGNAYATTPQYVQKPDSECGGFEGLGGGFRNAIYKTCGKQVKASLLLTKLQSFRTVVCNTLSITISLFFFISCKALTTLSIVV